MQINHPEFGLLDIDESQIMTFPDGLIGFEALRRFAFFHEANEDGETPLLFNLVAVDSPEVTFSITDPVNFGFRYQIDLTADERAALKLADGDEPMVAVMVYRPEEGGPKRRAGDLGIAAHLAAPLLINVEARLGLQKQLPKLGAEVTLSARGQ